MIQLVHQFDRPGVLAAAAPQSCGGCSCCSCCCCVVTTLAASVITARSMGRPFVPRAPAGAGAATEPPPRAHPAGVGAKVVASLLLPASVALGVAMLWADAEAAPFVAAGTWGVGLASLVATRRLRLRTAAAVFALGLAAFAAEFVIWLRLVVPQ